MERICSHVMENARLLTVFCKLLSLPDSRWLSQNFHVMFILKPTRMAMAIFYSLKLSGNSVFIAILVCHICQLLPSIVRGKTRTAHGGAFIQTSRISDEMDAGGMVGLSSHRGVAPPAVCIQHHHPQQRQPARPWAMIERTGNNDVAW